MFLALEAHSRALAKKTKTRAYDAARMHSFGMPEVPPEVQKEKGEKNRGVLRAAVLNLRESLG